MTEHDTAETAINDLHEALRLRALSYPETVEEHPWGETAIKVRGKVFLFLGQMEGDTTFSVKLPHSGEAALTLPFASPTGYGLGKHGWVSARLAPTADAPLDLFREWIDESYRAVAPKKLVAGLEPL